MRRFPILLVVIALVIGCSTTPKRQWYAAQGIYNGALRGLLIAKDAGELSPKTYWRIESYREIADVTLVEMNKATKDENLDTFKVYLRTFDGVVDLLLAEMAIVERARRDEEKKKGIEREKKSLEEKRTRITTYKETALKRKGEIEKNKKVRETLLTKTEKERIAYQKRVRKLEKASKELESLIRNLEAKKKETIEQARLASLAFRQKKRRLPWPTISHQVTKSYGKHQHPQYKTYTFHKGIDIKAPQGAEVWAASKGSIVFAQWSQKPGLREYGKMVMIAHGGGYYTLYAHLDSILVKENQEVEGGELIGKVGQTASKKGSYLYFEIRKDGAPLNPLHWLRK